MHQQLPVVTGRLSCLFCLVHCLFVFSFVHILQSCQILFQTYTSLSDQYHLALRRDQFTICAVQWKRTACQPQPTLLILSTTSALIVTFSHSPRELQTVAQPTSGRTLLVTNGRTMPAIVTTTALMSSHGTISRLHQVDLSRKATRYGWCACRGYQHGLSQSS